jgi:hypothetical protein
MKLILPGQIAGTTSIALGYFAQIPIPILIQKFLDWYQDPDAPLSTGFFYIMFFCIIAIWKPVVGERGLMSIFKNFVKVNAIMMVRILFSNEQDFTVFQQFKKIFLVKAYLFDKIEKLSDFNIELNRRQNIQIAARVHSICQYGIDIQYIDY